MLHFLKRIRTVIKSIFRPFPGVAAYWERRYTQGRTSGTGSYGKNAERKATFINNFIAKNNIKTVIEFGCGDGNQLLYAQYPLYQGFDISPCAVNKCASMFANDKTKSFCNLKDYYANYAQLAISLDIIFHLVEDDIYQKHLHRLFDSALDFVIIYSPDSDFNQWGQAKHIKNRKFTKWIKKNKPTWKLHPHTNIENNFYIYCRNL